VGSAAEDGEVRPPTRTAMALWGCSCWWEGWGPFHGPRIPPKLVQALRLECRFPLLCVVETSWPCLLTLFSRESCAKWGCMRLVLHASCSPAGTRMKRRPANYRRRLQAGQGTGKERSAEERRGGTHKTAPTAAVKYL